MKIDAQLDVSKIKCPMTFVKTKLFMEKMATGQYVEIMLKGEEAVHNMPLTLRHEGHSIIKLSAVEGNSDGLFQLIVKTG